MAGKFEIEISIAGTFNKDGSLTGWPVSGLMFAGNVIGGSGVEVGVDGKVVGVRVGVGVLELHADKSISKSKANFFMFKL